MKLTKRNIKFDFCASLLEERLPLQPKQQLVKEVEADQILYGGAGGGGKSFLLRWLAVYWSLRFANLQVYLFRKTFPEIVTNHLTGSWNILEMCQLACGNDKNLFSFNKANRIISFGNGSNIFLRHVNVTDLYKYQGAEIHLLLLDEATLFEDEIVRYLLSRNRVSNHPKFEHLLRYFPRAIFASNPVGVGFMFFKRHFIDNKFPNQVYEEEGVRRVFFPALLEDNKYIDQESYDATLKMLNPKFYEAIRYGKWEAPESIFFEEFDEKRHVVGERVTFSPTIKLVAGLDIGYTEPTAFIVGAVGNGEDVIVDGQPFPLPKNAVLFFQERLFCDPFDPSKGAKMSLKEIVEEIAKILGDFRSRTTIYTDLYFYQRNIDLNLFEIFQKNGLSVVVKTKRRKTSFDLFRERLRTNPALVYFTKNCKYAINYTKIYPKTPKGEPVDRGECTHMVDAIRLALNYVPISYDVRLTPRREERKQINILQFIRRSQKLW